MAEILRAFQWWVLLFLCLAAITAAAVVLTLAIGATLDPTSSFYSMVSSSLWTTVGPHFIAAALVAALLGLAGWHAGPCRLGQIAVALSILSLIGAVYIVWSITAAAVSAGGTVDPVAGLLLGRIDEPPPDRTEIVANVDGEELKVAVYLPRGRTTNAPVFVYIHGGGFMIGTNTETAADLRWFADRGWVVFSIGFGTGTGPHCDCTCPDATP